ncbi:MAG: maleylpyruvate isomerase family mycothiol-dependent enzyme [Acidimicrobiales bacterium]
MVPLDTVDKLVATFDSLGTLCAGLTEEQWKMPTQLPGWSVQDNLSHIIGTERALYGLPETEHRASDLSNTRNPIGEMNEHHVDYRRGWPGERVLAEFLETARMRTEQLRTADENYFNTEAMTPTGPGTIADFLHIRVMDVWVHEQDMRRTLGMPGNRGGGAAEHSLDRLIRTVPIVVGKRAATPEGGCVVIRITGAVQRTVVTTVTDGRARMGGDPPTGAICDISMDSDVFLQLATGRGEPSALAARCSVTGDAAHAQKVMLQFNMMI